MDFSDVGEEVGEGGGLRVDADTAFYARGEGSRLGTLMRSVR